MDTSSIAILSTVSNFELYNKTSPHFPKGIQKLVIDGRNGMHGIHSLFYMMEILKGRRIDWLIMADEDVLFTEPTVIFDIIEQMKTENATVCGVRDGGVIPHRSFNPFMINTFFSILHFSEVERIWNKKVIRPHQYVMANEFIDDLSHLKGRFDVLSLYEPYYCFYFWLRRNGKKFLFLDAEILEDGLANSLIFNNTIFAYHTWNARSYGVNKKHTERINLLMQRYLKEANPLPIDAPLVFKKKSFKTVQMVFKFMRRVKAKIYKWIN